MAQVVKLIALTDLIKTPDVAMEIYGLPESFVVNEDERIDSDGTFLPVVGEHDCGNTILNQPIVEFQTFTVGVYEFGETVPNIDSGINIPCFKVGNSWYTMVAEFDTPEWL